MLRLLCVTAHPDDEAGGFGGSLALYSGRGVETSVICLTPGQAATHRGDTRSDEELAERRRQEFADSCRILGVRHREVLNFRDAHLAEEPLLGVVGELVWRIRQIRPHVIITFGPEGALTAHPDHSMAGVFATMAFHWAGRTNRYPEQLSIVQPHRAQKLYYGTALFTLPDRQPVSPAPVSAVIEIGSCWDRKIQAFRAHLTQAPLFPLFEKNISQRGWREMFHLAAVLTPRDAVRETDLFEGVTDD